MTCESGNTEGLEPVDFRPISRPWDWNLWTSGPFQDHGLGMLGLLDHLGQDLFLANQAGWGFPGGYRHPETPTDADGSGGGAPTIFPAGQNPSP